MKQLEAYNIIGPKWNGMDKVKAFTILALDKKERIVSFRGKSRETESNRRNIESIYGDVHWIKQEHKNKISVIPNSVLEVADGVYTKIENTICSVTTADCLPIIFASESQSEIGITHTGWRGLTTNILSKMINQFDSAPETILVWIGPGIGQNSYEVGAEVKAELVAINESYESAFCESENNKYYLDLYKIAKAQLLKEGIREENTSGAKWNTFSNNFFHSARRDKKESGRMLTMVCIENPAYNIV